MTCWFFPGEPQAPEGPLARYRPPVLATAAAHHIRTWTEPGALVLDLFCQGPAFIREALLAGRRAIGANANPVGLLIASLELEPTPPDLRVALTRLGDTLKETPGKRPVPLFRHILAFYRARCPTCRAEGTAEWFAWDRETRVPYAKAVRCPRCGPAQEGPTDEEDLVLARRFEPRGLAYHYLLDRAAPLGNPVRERAGELVDLYTPRNLTALMDILIRAEGMSADRPLRAALQGLLLEAMDRAAGLDPHGESRPRPRMLRLPGRFLERNVWFLLEEELERRLARTPPPPVRRASSLQDLLSGTGPAYFLLPAAARDLPRHLPPGSVSLILADPPRPDGVFWALSALWSNWLWDTPISQALRPLLGRRRFDWDWHQEALQVALAAVAPLLAPDGHLVLLFAERNEDLVAAVSLAASAAGYDLVGWGASPEVGCQLVWRRRRETSPPAPLDTVSGLAAEALRECLRQRAEPSHRFVLHTAVYADLARRRAYGPFSGIVHAVREGWESLDLELLDEDFLWLPSLESGPGAEVPLADRVEERVWSLLAEGSPQETEALMAALYGEFGGPLTPDPSLVYLCLQSYGETDGRTWRLREEDVPDRRREEIEALRRDLEALGRRLHFRLGRGRGWDLRWREKGRDVYLFRFSPTASLGVLRTVRVPAGARPCLVIPGGRAELLAAKLRRDPRLARAVWETGWQLVKFRHLRRLAAEATSRRMFEVMLGLDPVVGPRGVQIRLIPGGEG
ncbi:MAG: hypothetical protein RMK65_04750 [Anaerolineae bacterium]|nr:hypothetical protein [Anaerolineae bacterium]